MKREDVKNEERQSPRRKWIRRILIAALLVLVGAIGGGQIVLWSDLPRRVAVAALQRQLGLSVSADSLSTGWFGHSTLRNFRVGLPLAEKPLLDAPLTRVSHTSILGLVFGRSLRIERIELSKPTLVARQMDGGQWNLLQAIELIERARPPQPAQPPSRRLTAAAIPTLIIHDANVLIVDRDGNEARITPLNATGRADGLLTYRFNASCQQNLSITGSLVPGGAWIHEAQVKLADADAWLGSFAGDWADRAAVQAQWRGQRIDGGVQGRLEIGSLTIGDTTAAGPVDVVISRGALSLRPRRLVLLLPEPLAQEGLINAGVVELAWPTLRATHLRLETAEGIIELNGWWNQREQAAEARAAWRDLALPAGVRHSGSFDAKLLTDFPNRPRITATLLSNGNAELAGTWNLRAELHAQGSSFRDLSWQATLPVARVERTRPIDLAGLTAYLQSTDRLVTLRDITLPQRGRLTGRGQLDLRNDEWWLWVSGGDFVLPAQPDAAITFDVNTWGRFNGKFITFDKVYLSAGDVELWMNGLYDARLSQPLALKAWLTHLPDLGADESAMVRGTVRGRLDLVGRAPLDMTVAGDLYARDLFIRDRAVGDITAEVAGHISSDWVDIRSSKLKLVGAEWDISGRWPIDPDRDFELIVDARDLPLSEVGALLGDENLAGVASAHVEMKLPAPRLDVITADGTFHAKDVSRGDLRAQRITAQLSLRDGQVRIDPIELTEGAGHANANAEADLVRPTLWNLTASLNDWPIRFEGAEGSIIVSGQTRRMQIDLRNRAALGDVRLDSEFVHAGFSVGTASLKLSAGGRVLHVRQIQADALGGGMSGSGTFDLDRPLRTTASFEWHNVDAARLRDWFPRLDNLAGVFAGELKIAPENAPRALGPLRIDFSLASPDAHLGAMPLRTLHFSAFADLNRPNEKFHIVAPDALLVMADGQADLFARLTIRRDNTLSALVTGGFANLSLDQIVHTFDPNAEPMPGRLAGSLMLAGDPRFHRDLVGDVTVDLSQTDLINFDPLGLLYNLMHVGGKQEGPRGTGIAKARLDNRNLEITSVYLENRGVEIRGTGTIRDIFAIPDSPVSGMFIGMTRPLKDVRLPFMADVDQVFTAIQANATTVEVSGTLRDPAARPTTLDDISDAMRALLLSDVARERAR